MAVINDYCIVLNNKLEPSDRWHNLAVMSISFMCLISTLWISASSLPCPWEIVLRRRKPVKGDGRQFLWECEESSQSVALRKLDFCCTSFLNMQDESSWIVHKPDPLLLREIFSLTKVFLAGRCLLTIPVMGVSFCVSRCTKYPKQGKGFSIPSTPSPHPSPP